MWNLDPNAPFQIGDWVSIRNSTYKMVRIAGYVGALGPKSARVYKIRLTKKPLSYVDVLEEQLEHVAEESILAARAEVGLAFRETVKTLQCPACKQAFTDFAVNWVDAWREGRRDLAMAQGQYDGERDGPFKLKCEQCGQKSWLDYVERSVRRAGA